MEKQFWNDRWKNNDIGFHQGIPNALLTKYFTKLSLPKNSRLFLPLCGKTYDISWLRSQGYRIAGAELVEDAVKQLFAELKMEAEITSVGKLKRYSTQGIDIFVGDIFDLTPETLGPIDAIYDRAALVALPQQMRDQYTKHLRFITGGVPQLLIAFEYDQTKLPGPPFSVPEAEVRRQYSNYYSCTLLETVDVPGGLKGKCPAIESIWRLTK